MLPGRTARIGNEGLATSFYNEMDEPMAPFLAKILVETGNAVPDFLEQFKPAVDEPIDFDDDSGDEENDALVADQTNGDAGDAWGATETDTAVAHETNGVANGLGSGLDGGWGEDIKPAANTSFEW